MLHLEDVRVRYDSGTEALRGITLTVAPGSACAVVGANGSGKSTLGFCAAGILPRLVSGTRDGSVSVDGASVDELPLDQLVNHVGYAFQNMAAQLVTLRVRDELQLGVEAAGGNQGTVDHAVERLAQRFNLTHLLERQPLTLSMGEQHRLALASLFASSPRYLVLDEPGAALDEEQRGTIFRALDESRRNGTGLLILFSTLDEMPTWLDHTIGLRDGCVVYSGSSRELPEAAIFDTLMSTPDVFAADERIDRGTLLSVEDCSFRYRRTQPLVLERASLEINSGDIIAVSGANGAGKSTLLHLIAGLRRPTAGVIAVKDTERPIHRLAPAERVRHAGLVFQNPSRQIFADTIADELSFGIRLQGTSKDAAAARAYEISKEFMLAPVDRDPRTLSFGWQKRLTLASMVALRPSVLLLDEPELGVDPPGRELLRRVIHSRARTGGAVVLVTHNAAFATQVATRRVRLDEGKLHAVLRS